MELIRAKDTVDIVFRYTSGNLELGLHPVLFGVRVRAGYIGTPFCNIDWCCGDSPGAIKLLFNIAYGILSLRNNEDAFNGVPGYSNIKPAFLDPDFMRIITQIAKQKGTPIDTPSFPELKKLMFVFQTDTSHV